MSGNTKLLKLEESVLLAMAANPSFVSEFPFLKQLGQLRRTRAGCGRCNKSAAKRIQLITAAKQSIVNMGVEKKRKLKTMLKADKVRLRFASGGQVKEITF